MTALDRLARAQETYLTGALARLGIDDATANEIAERHARGMWHPALRPDTIVSRLLVQRHHRELSPVDA